MDRSRKRPAATLGHQRKADDGGTATISYTLTPESQGTRFKREFIYHIPALFVESGDFLSSHNRLQAESAESLRHLKRMLEDGAVEGDDEVVDR